MKFSILVPVYNVERYLKQCLDSLVEQTYEDYEIILVDDGSTDRSSEFCDSYALKYPKKIKVIHKKNQGLISARRVAIAEASGEFCIFVDSDDYVEKNLLEIVYSYLKTDKEIDVLLYSYRYIRNKKIEERKMQVAVDGTIWNEMKKRDLYRKLITTSEITSLWTKAIRTSLLKSDKTDYSIYYQKNMAEDLLQSLYPLTYANKIMYTEHVLYNYRINDESSSRSFHYSTIPGKNTIHVYEKIREYLPIWEMDDSDMIERLNAQWFHEMMYFFTKYFEYANSKEERSKVLEFNWKSMLPTGIFNQKNQYFNEKYITLYMLLEQKNRKKIEAYFWRKKWYQRIRNWKRKLKV